MTDMLGDGLHAVASRSLAAYPLLAIAGAASGIGPCAAPRTLSLAALVQTSRRPVRDSAAFVAGLILAYAFVGVAAGALAAMFASSRLAYGIAAAAFAIAGAVALAQAGGARCTAHAHARPHAASAGGALLLGASGALLVSPCCAPAVTAIAGLTAASGRGAAGIALIVAFACGHAVPAVAAAYAGTRCARLLRSALTAQAPAIVAGTLSLALAAYYAVLA